MSLMDRFKRSKAEAVKDRQPIQSGITSADLMAATRRRIEEIQSRYRGVTPEMRELQLRAHGTVFTCASIVARQLAAVPVRLYRADRKGGRVAKHLRNHERVGKASFYADAAGGAKEVTNHPVLDLLRDPSPFQSAYEFRLHQFINHQIFGNSYAVWTREGYWISLLSPYVRVIADDSDSLIQHYEYSRDHDRYIEIDPGDVLHVRHTPSLESPYLGVGPGHNSIAEMDLDDAAMAAETYRWINGGAPSGVVSLKGANQNQIDATQSAFTNRHSGVHNQGGWIVTGEAAVTVMGKPHEMGYVEGLEVVTRRILADFGVPESMYRMNDANLASSTNGHLQFMRNTIQPQIVNICEQYTDRLLPKFGLEPGEWYFAPDDVVPEDVEAKRANAQMLVPIGVMTLNEAREEFGLGKIEGGDVPRVAGVPLDDVVSLGAGFFPPAVNDTRDEADNVDKPKQPQQKIEEQALNGAQIAQLTGLATQVQLGELPRTAARAVAAAAFPGVPDEKLDAIFTTLVEGGSKPKDPADPPSEPEPKAKAVNWGDDDPYAPGLPCGCIIKDAGIAIEQAGGEVERALRDAVAGWFDSINSDLSRYIQTDGTVDLSGTDSDLLEAIAPHLEGAYIAGSEEGLQKLADGGFVDPDEDGEFSIENVDATAYVDRQGSLIIEQVRGTTEDGLRSLIRDNLRSGEPLSDLVPRIRDHMGDITPARAEAIARTETSNAIHEAEVDQFKTIGVEFVAWMNSPNPSPVHAEISRRFQKHPVGEPFIEAGTTISAGGKTETYTRDVYHPPARPNCRCWLMPVEGGE